MSRVLRGVWSRRGALATLVLMTTVVVGGAVTVLQFAVAAGTSAALTAPLLLLGAVAVPSIGAELAVARREEIGLARLRGIHGVRLWRFLLVEPLLAIGVGTALGLAVGAAGTVAATGAWLDEAAPALGRTSVLAALAIAGAAWVIVGLGAGAALREPLSVQVSMRRRPRRATTLVIFLSLLVAVGAGVAAYRSRAADGEPDLVVLLGPALVGLALGQAAIWLVRAFARGLTPTTGQRGMSGFLATRRLARADDLVTPVRLVVAAAVVGALALTGALSVDRWTDTQARVEVPGARVIDAGNGGVGALTLSQRLDPEGTHLIATTLVRNEERLAERRAYVDASRWDAVVGDYYAGTPVQAPSRSVPGLAGDVELATATGDRLTVDVSSLAQSPRRPVRENGVVVGYFGLGDVTVDVDYVTADDGAGTASVDVHLDGVGDRATGSVRVPDCADGCVVTGLGLGRRLDFGAYVDYDTTDFSILLEQATLGDLDLVSRTWVPDRDELESTASFGSDPGGRLVVNRRDGLEADLLATGSLPLLLDGSDTPVALLVAGDERSEDGPVALDLGGDDRETEVDGRAATLPLVGTVGTLGDLRTAALGSGPTVPRAEARVVAAAGTPAAMLDEAEQATGNRWRPLSAVRSQLGEANGGAQARAYALTALACALVALLALGAGVARHLRDYRRDVASLRVLGIGLGTARRAGRTELVALTVLVTVAAAAGGWLAVELLLGGLPLLALPVAALPLDTSPGAWSVLVPALLAAAAVVVVGGRARAVRATSTRPSLLREEEGR